MLFRSLTLVSGMASALLAQPTIAGTNPDTAVVGGGPNGFPILI